MRAIWSFMDLMQQYWLRQSRHQYCCRRSIKPILPDITGQYLFLILYVKCLWFKVLDLWIHILLARLLIYYHSQLYSLGMVLLLWHFCQTIVKYDGTIIQYDITIVAQWRQTILENIDWSIWYFESVRTITEGHETRNLPISIEYLHLIW